MIDIDWSKAPEGATHYTPKGTGVYAAFWRKHCGEWKDAWVIEGQGGELIHYKEPTSPSFESLAVERPTTPSWSGEGLPPVGVVCEVRNAPGGWGKATIKYQGKGVTVWLWDRPDGNTDQIEFASCPDRLEFRPIRTPEQIAADEREAAICNMARIALKGSDNLINKQWLENLYDDGYRKP